MILTSCLALYFTLAAPASVQADEFFDSGGTRIHYQVHGEGEPLVLMHGFAANLELWKPSGLLEPLAEQYRVILVDARGHGLSGKPTEPEHYGLEMVEDVVRMLDHLEIERAHVLGYSMGGMIALKLLSEHPERLASVVAGGYGWREIHPVVGEDLMDRVADSLDRGEGFGPLHAALVPEGAEEPSPAMIEAITKQVLAVNDPRALAAAARGFRHLGLEKEALRRNRVPTLAVIGELDGLRPDVDRLAGALASLEVRVVEGGTHMTAGLDPRFLAWTREFLGSHPIEALEPAGVGR